MNFRFIIVVLVNLVNNFIDCIKNTFYFVVAMFRTKGTIVCLFDIQTYSFFAHNELHTFLSSAKDNKLREDEFDMSLI